MIRESNKPRARTRPPGVVVLTVHVQPRAKRTEVAGWRGDAVKIRVTAPPVDGRANDELVRFIAAALRIPRSHVAIVSGDSGRRKVLRLTGVSADDLRESLTRLAEGS